MDGLIAVCLLPHFLIMATPCAVVLLLQANNQHFCFSLYTAEFVSILQTVM